MKKKYFMKMLLFAIFFTLGVAGAIGMEVYAGTPAVKSNIDAFDSLKGQQKYIQDKYFDNYTLDQEKLGTFDVGPAISDVVAEFLFFIIKKLAQVTVTIFYYCMDFDIASLFSSQLNAIQAALHETIFEPLFILAFCFTGIMLFKKYIKRDLAGAYGQMVRVILLVVLSILIVRNSAAVLSTATGIAKNIGTQAITGVNGQSQNSGTFAAKSAGVLWLNLVHQPWVTIEFGEDAVSSETIEQFMNPANAKGTESREKLVENYNGNAFSKERAVEKLGFIALYLFPFLFKCLIYIAISLIQLVFQFMAIFYVVLAPIILILSMFPGYEGVIGSWLRKILESQLSIILITFLLGLLIKFDEMLYGLSSEFGWLIVVIIQICVEAGVILKREALLNTFSNIQRGISTPGYAMAAMKRSGNVKEGVKGAQKMVQQVKRDAHSVRAMPSKVKQSAVNVANSRPVQFAAKGASAVGGMVSSVVQTSREADRMEAWNSYQIDKKTGELKPGRSYQEYEKEKNRKAERAEKKWQTRMENYDSTKKAPPIKKSYVLKPTKWENMKVVENAQNAPKTPQTVQRPKSSTPPQKDEIRANESAGRVSRMRGRT